MPPAMNKLKGMMNLMKSGGNPKGMMQNMLMSNPKYGAVMDLVNQYGGDARAAFYGECQKAGIDPNQIISMLK